MSLPLTVPAEHVESPESVDAQHATLETQPSHIYDAFFQPSSLFLLPEGHIAKPFKRFVILVPCETFSAPDLSFKMGGYTQPGTSILFVARVTNPDEELAVQRQVVLLETMARSLRLPVQYRCEANGSWMDIVKEIWHEGDLVICLEDLQVRQFLLGSIPLGKKIFSSLRVPVLIHQDIHLWERSPFQRNLREIAASILFLATILLFTLLQINVDRAVAGWAGKVMLCLMVAVELFCVWKIDQFFN